MNAKEPELKTGQETSAGGVVYKKDEGKIKIALIHRRDRNVWCLPKGKLEKGETPEEAAIREVEEETGLKGDIERKIGDIKYWYISKERKLKISKVVSFYLLKHAGGNTNSHDREVDDCKWFDIEEALNLTNYKGEIEVITSAREMLKNL